MAEPTDQSSHQSSAGSRDYETHSSHSSNRTGGQSNETVMREGYALQSGFRDLPRRPNYIPDENDFDGQIAHLNVVGNSFRVTLNPDFDCEIIKYDVIFDPPLKEDSNEREEVLMSVRASVTEVIGDHALDNARIYSWKPITWDDKDGEWTPRDTIRITYDTDENDNPKFVELRAGQRNQLAQMDLQYQQQVLSVCLRELARKCGFMRMGRNHYDPTAADRQVEFPQKNRYKGLLNMMDGFRMSLEYTTTVGMDDGVQNAISLTIDACSRVLDPRNVQEIVSLVQNTSQNWGVFKKTLIQELRGRAVITSYNNKIYKISEILFNANPSTQEMEDPEGKKSTVTEYYKSKYNLAVADHTHDFGGVLLVHDLSPRKRDRGKTRPLYLVPAQLRLTGYPPLIRKNHALMKKLSRANKIPSEIRCKKVEECAQKLAREASISDSPLVIVPDLMKIKGRIVGDAPIFLKKKAGAADVVKIGVSELQAKWKKHSMFGSATLGNGEWIMVAPKKIEKKMDKLYKKMADQANSIAPDALGKPDKVVVVGKAKNWQKELSAALSSGNYRAVVAIIPCGKQPGADDKQRADEIYSVVKLVCSKDFGVASQCIQSCNLETSHVQTGITRQLFTKLGSLPWKLQFCLFGDKLNIKVPTMLIGIDVNHDRKESQSPVAFVSTWDRDFVQVHSQLSYHKLADEVLNPQEMSIFFTNALEHFKNKNRVYPTQVIVYRDGIASTQIEHVQKNEITGINQAIKDLGLKSKKDIKIEFILVNKRVNSRFVEAETKLNVPKGLIVDNNVVSSQYWDFYLTPADAPEGCTSTPTRFIIIRDDLHLSQKKATLEIESFTKQLCNLYYNWPGPVRVPAIVKNADKLTTQFGSAVNGQNPHHLLEDTYHFL